MTDLFSDLFRFFQSVSQPNEAGGGILRLEQRPGIEGVAVIHIHRYDSQSWSDEGRVIAAVSHRGRDVLREPFGPLRIGIVVEPGITKIWIRNFRRGKPVTKLYVLKLFLQLFLKLLITQRPDEPRDFPGSDTAACL